MKSVILPRNGKGKEQRVEVQRDDENSSGTKVEY
jgi:hypothetical protein